MRLWKGEKTLKFKNIKIIAFMAVICLIFTTSAAFADTADRASLRGTVVRHINANVGINMLIAMDTTIEYVPATGISVFLLKNGVEISTSTNRNGEFEFVDIEAGEYELVIYNPLYMSMSLGLTLGEGEDLNLDEFFPYGIPLGSTFYSLIGVNRVDEVYFSRESVEVMQAVFADYNGLSRETAVIPEGKFTKAEAYNYIKQLGSRANFSDQLVFFYYGGIFINEANGKAYLDCDDAVFISGKPVYETLISEDELITWFNECFVTSPNISFIFDAPNSDVLARRIVTGLNTNTFILAAAEDDCWYEFIDINMGAFTFAIATGLLSLQENSTAVSMDLNSDGFVSIRELAAFTAFFVDIIFEEEDVTQVVKGHANSEYIVENSIFFLNR